jgi:competence ComEA-like helix-hairpin-helix protein
MLLALAALGGVGIAAGNWRRAHPDLTERVEGFDAEYVTEPSTPRRPDTTPPDDPPSTSSGPASDAAETSAGLAASRSSSPQQIRRDPLPGGTSTDTPLDLNRATARELERLPGIGRALAERIVASREQGGGFESVEDLHRVPGLVRAKISRLRDRIAVID